MLWPVISILLLVAGVALHLWWRARFNATRDAAQKQIESLRDSARLKEAEIQSQQSALFDSMVEGFLLLDASGRVRLANRACAQLFGLSGGCNGKTLIEVLRVHEVADLVASLNSSKQVLAYELNLSRPAERWIEINGAAIFNESGARQGTVLVFHDLTRLKKLERTREEFVANVSHELRTPLSLIKGYAETLLEGAKDDPGVATRFLRTIDRNSERLRLLIEDLLTISELESGRLRLNLQPVQLRGAVQRVLDDLNGRASVSDATLVNHVPDLLVRADPDRLEQVLGNLVDNAIKYGGPEVEVVLSARPLENRLVEISVQDSGPGIPAEALERIFERFYRVDKARSREQGGTGLGLSIVKHIVQSHGGRAWAKSEPGKGATFTFTIPQA